MLSLDSDRWAKLSHAYGNASDVPVWLPRLSTAPPLRPDNDSPWHIAWDSLCHQFTVFTASYAAVPHLVKMATTTRSQQRLEFLDLVSAIEAFRYLPTAPYFPRGLKQPYLDAIRKTKSLALASLKEEWSEESMRRLLGIIAVSSGHPRLGTGISAGDAEYECRKCGAAFILPGYIEFDPA